MEDGKRCAAGGFGLCQGLAELRSESAPASILLWVTRLCWHICKHTPVRTYTHTYTSLSDCFPPPNYSSSVATLNIPHARRMQAVSPTSWIWWKGCRGDRISVSFSTFKCHEDWVVLIWRQTWINNICHSPSAFLPGPPVLLNCVIFMSGQPPVSVLHSCP